MGNVTFYNYFKRLFLLVTAILGFSLTSVAQSWTPVYSNSLSYPGDTFIAEAVDPIFESQTSDGGIYWLETKSLSLLEPGNVNNMLFSTYGNNPTKYFTLKVNVAEAGNYKFSYRFLSGNDFGMTLFYTSDDPANQDSRIKVKADAPLTKNVAETLESDVFEITDAGDYYFGFYVSVDAPGGYSGNMVFADFQLLKEVGAGETTYTVTWDKPANGALTVKSGENLLTSPATVPANTEIVVEAAPDYGYELETLTSKVGDAAAADIENGAVVTVSGNTVIAATFKELDKYAVTVAQVDESKGSVVLEVNNSTFESGSSAYLGETVKVTVYPVEGYKLTELTYTVGDGTPQPVEFEKGYDYYTGEFEVQGETTVNVAFAEMNNYLVSVSDGIENGELTFYVDGEEFTPGNSVQEEKTVYVYGNPSPGYKLSKVTYTVEGETEPVDITEGMSFVVKGNTEVNAEFVALKNYTVKVDESIQNGALMLKLNGNLISSGKEVQEGNTVTVEVNPDLGYVLESLSYKVDDGEPVDITEVRSFVVSGPTVVSAEFKAQSYTVTWTDSAKGSLTVQYIDADGNEQNVESGVTNIPAGATIEVSASITDPNADILKSITYVNNDIVGASPVELDYPYTFTLDGNVTLVADFGSPEFSWSITGRYAWATFYVEVDGERKVSFIESVVGPFGGTFEVQAGTVVKITATIPENALKQNLLPMLSVDGESVELDENGVYEFEMPAKSVSVVLNIDIPTYLLTIDQTGEGTVAISSGGTEYSGAEELLVERNVEFEVIATPAQGYGLKSVEVTIGGEVATPVNGIYTATGDIVVKVVFYDLSSISSIDSGDVYYSNSDETLYLDKEYNVRVYDLSGRLVLNVSGQNSVSMSELGNGVYTAVAGDKVLKFVK